MSDTADLSNFVCNKKEGPVYIAIGNLSSKIRQMTLTHSIVMFAVLPILIKTHRKSQKRLEDQRQTHQ
jgi:hypothetical protein